MARLMPMSGNARRGLGLWLWQRASGLYLALFFPAFGLHVALSPPVDFVAWQALFRPMHWSSAVLLAVTALLIHAWIGIREVLIDYVHPVALRLALYFAFAMLYAFCLILSAEGLWALR